MPVVALSLGGCGEILEANIKAVETLSSDDAAGRDKGLATAVVAGTVTATAALIVAVAITSATDWTPDDPPPEDYVAAELGWGLERVGADVSWRRCNSRIFCTEERRSAVATDVLSTSTVGRVVPNAMGGRGLDEVDVVELRVRHHN